MARDYIALVAALRRKAADPAVGEHERTAFTAKADELAKTHNIIETRRTVFEGVPTFDELVQRLRKEQWVEQAFSFKMTNLDLFDINLDEDPKQNGNYEFPGEEYLE